MGFPESKIKYGILYLVKWIQYWHGCYDCGGCGGVDCGGEGGASGVLLEIWARWGCNSNLCGCNLVCSPHMFQWLVSALWFSFYLYIMAEVHSSSLNSHMGGVSFR